MTEDRSGIFELGTATRREVPGERHVDSARASVTEVDVEFQRLITEMAWGSVWARPGLDRRTRIVTIALLAGLGRDELDLHLKAPENCGVELNEIIQTLFQVAAYAGVPAANNGFSRLKKMLAE